MTLPIVIIWVIGLSVIGIVMGAAFSHSSGGSRTDMTLVTVAALTLWILGLTLGSFVTYFSSPTPETWWHALTVRVAWQVGGAVFFGIALMSDTNLLGNLLRKPGAWAFIAACMAFGTLLSLNPIRDLIDGPVVVRGTAEIEVERRSRARGGASIWAEVRFTASDGADFRWRMAGWPAERAEEVLNRCADTEDIEITMLRRMKRMLDVRCEPAERD